MKPQTAQAAVEPPEPIAQTERGTPVFLIAEQVPETLLPRSGRTLSPIPAGPLAEWIAVRHAPPCVVIVKRGKRTRIFKLTASGDVIVISARSIQLDDRKRLVEAGIIPKS